MKDDAVWATVTGILALLVIVLLLLAALFAPCWLFTATPAGEVPARCLQQFVHGGH